MLTLENTDKHLLKEDTFESFCWEKFSPVTSSLFLNCFSCISSYLLKRRERDAKVRKIKVIIKYQNREKRNTEGQEIRTDTEIIVKYTHTEFSVSNFK